MFTRKTFGFLAAVALLICLMTAVVAQEGKVDLKLRLQQGQTFKIRTTSDHGGSASVDGNAFAGREVFTTGLIFLVQSVDSEGAATLKITFDNPTYSSGATAGGEVVDQLNKVLGSTLASLSGRSFTAQVMPNGVVRQIEGVQDVVDGALQGLAGQPAVIKGVVETAMRQSINEAVLKEGLESMFSILPGHPVDVNERWSRQSAISTGQRTKQSDIFCRIAERSNGVSKIKVYEQIKSYKSKTAFDHQLVLKGTSEGFVEIEEATGLILKGNFTTSLTGHSVITAGSQQKKLPTSISGTSTISRY